MNKMENFSNLQKLLVIVPSNQCTNFRNNHITGASSSDDYWNRLAFLEDTNEIYTHGQIYGSSGDISSIKAILSGYGDEGRYATVQGEIDEIITALQASNIISLSYTTGTGYAVEDKISLTYTNGFIQLGGGTSYGTPLGNQLAIADSADDIAYTGDFTYVAATPTAIKEYLSAELGDIANAVTLEGGKTELETILFSGEYVTKKAVGNQYIMDTAYTFYFPPEGQTGATQYKLKAGDSVFITKVENGAVTTIKAVERNLDGAVTASAALTTNHVVIGAGNPADQTVVASAYVIGTDNDEITSLSAANTLATEKAVAAAISSVSDKIDNLDVSYSYQGTWISYSYTQTDGLIQDIKVSVDIASVDDTTGTVTGSGLIDGTAATNIITYVTNSIEGLDVTQATVTASPVTTGTTDNGLYFSYSESNGIVTIDGFAYTAAYVSVADNLVTTVERSGLVTGELLKNVINSLNPWELYTVTEQEPGE